QINLIDVGRRGLDSRRLLGLHVCQGLEQPEVQAPAIEQCLGRVGVGQVQPAARLPIVDQQCDVGFLDPQFLHAVDLLVVDQGLGQVDRIDAAGGGARQDIKDEAGPDGGIMGQVGLGGVQVLVV